MDSQFMRCSIKLTIHFFYFHTDKTTHVRLQGHSHFTKALHFSQTLTITFLFREVPVKLLLRLLQVFFAYTFAPKYTGGLCLVPFSNDRTEAFQKKTKSLI